MSSPLQPANTSPVASTTDVSNARTSERSFKAKLRSRQDADTPSQNRVLKSPNKDKLALIRTQILALRPPTRKATGREQRVPFRRWSTEIEDGTPGGIAAGSRGAA